MKGMSDGTFPEPQLRSVRVEGDGWSARRRRHEALGRMCESIRLDGVTDGEAALLAGLSEGALREWKREDERCALALAKARAEYRQARLAAIREVRTRDGALDWRCQAWLLKQSAEGAAAEGQEEGEDEEGAGAFRLAITPKHLAELQRRRMAALERMRAKRDESEEVRP